MSALTVSRAIDRATMSARVQALSESLGATVARDALLESGRNICLRIRANRGLCVSVDFDGDSRQQREGVWVLSWHMALDSDACLDDSFGGSVNRSHWRKATYVARGFENLLELLELGLCKARDGDAFSAEREAASIAKNGTAAENAAKWAGYRAEEDAKRAELTAEGLEAVDYAEVSAAGGYGVRATLEALQARYGADGARFISGIGYWARQVQRAAA